jgi:mRNA interferase RelE/StbE
MNYNVLWDKKSLNFLNKLEPFIAQRIIKLVREFSENPRSKQFKKLKNERGFRLRAGDYRIIFDFNPNTKTIQILKVGHRKNIYE